MQRITPSDIQKLTKYKDQPVISIYMPTQGSDFADNRAYLKRLLSAAREELTRFVSYKEKHEALYPAYRLLHDRNWWRFVDAGVAIFSHRDHVFAYHLSEAPKEQIMVSNRFHVLPLVQHLNQRGNFYVLALSAKNTRLLHCNGEDMFELSVPNMPRSVTDVSVRDDYRKVQLKKGSKPKLRHALVALREGGRRAIKRQQYDAFEMEYLQHIYHAVHGVIARTHEPLVLAGLQRVQSMYRRIDTSPYIFKEGISGNPDRLNNLELRDRARQALGDYFTEGELAAQSHFLRLSVARPEKIVYGLKNVLRFIHEGRVQMLFVDREARAWGKIQRQLVEVHANRLGGDSDLIDVAAGETVRRKGSVFTLEPSDLPLGSKVAAILRY